MCELAVIDKASSQQEAIRSEVFGESEATCRFLTVGGGAVPLTPMLSKAQLYCSLLCRSTIMSKKTMYILSLKRLFC